MKLILSHIMVCLCGMLTAQHIILQDAQVIDVMNNLIIPNQTLEIVEGRIHNIHDGRFEDSDADTIIDLQNRYVIPGLIDCHTHIEHSGNWETTSKYNPPRESLVALLEHAVRGGVTTIREMACDVRVMAELSRAAKLDLISSPDIYYPSLFASPSFSRIPGQMPEQWEKPRDLPLGSEVSMTNQICPM